METKNNFTLQIFDLFDRVDRVKYSALSRSRSSLNAKELIFMVDKKKHSVIVFVELGYFQIIMDSAFLVIQSYIFYQTKNKTNEK